MSSPKKLTLETETEHLLYKHVCEEKKQREKLQSLVTELQNQIEVLQEQLKCMAENAVKPTPTTMETNISPPRVEYTTDEEELATETEWIRSKTRKKRKLNTSPALDVTSNENNKSNEKVHKVPLPPPIVVDGVKNYQNFYDYLSENQVTDGFSVKMMHGGTVKVNAKNDEAYRAITKALELRNCFWHSYENKQVRPIRVMAKKLHFSCKPERIVEDLQNKGLKIVEAVNKLSWKTKEPLNMFMLTFSNDEEINKIYNIKTVLGCSVEIQPIKTNKLVPQCKKCQAYGHTQKYCSKEPRCVKCTGKHLTKDCIKPREEKPKCVHCGAPHPANYRGCTIAKEIQLLRNKTTNKSTVVPQKKKEPSAKCDALSQPKTNVKANNYTAKNITYAQVTARDTIPAPEVSANSDQKLDEILKFMATFDERLKKIEGSAKTATYKSRR